MKDINITDRSPTVGKNVIGDSTPSLPYKVNNIVCTLLYFLAVGIYPDWAIFVKTIKGYLFKKELMLESQQQAVEKDVQRAFGVLVAHLHILQSPAPLRCQ